MKEPDLIDAISRAGPAPALIDIDPDRGWRHVYAGLVSLWFKGEPEGGSAERLVRHLADAGMTLPDPAGLLAPLRGHFALAAAGPGWALAAVDRMRSTPLLFARTPEGVVIAVQIGRVLRRMPAAAVDPDAALALAMSGHTVGTDSLYRDIALLAPGEALTVTAETGPRRVTYHRYEPWRVAAIDGPALQQRLADRLLASLEPLARNGRPLAVFLDTSLDGWIVASGLHRLGCSSVRCYSVGPAGHPVVEAGRRFAGTLGYPWRTAPPGTPQRLETVPDRAFVAAADSGGAVLPGLDLTALAAFRDAGWLPAETIVINSGAVSALAGAAIPPPLQEPRRDLDAAGRRRLILDELVSSGFRLWESLATEDHDARIRGRLAILLEAGGAAADDPQTAHGLAEYADLENRLGKLERAGPRTAEAVDLDWRAPLLSDACMDFWQAVPLSAKAGQRLLHATLDAENWGGAWDPWPLPDRDRAVPRWMRWLVRPGLNALTAPFGRRTAERLLGRLPGDWLADPAMAPLVAFGTAIRDGRGARSRLAWRTEAYLRRHGLDYAGFPLAAPLPAPDDPTP